MPSRAEHRASIRNAIHLALLDLQRDLQWSSAEDDIFDAVDRWLESKPEQIANDSLPIINFPEPRPDGPSVYDDGEEPLK